MSIENALVVGGGAAGAATAILLARAGVAVDLVEAQADVATSGSGITLQGNALRVFSPT
jgi:2-polyprenyl-6-methoxyphenol hydroxylase-like FAD-dependent oxidoreductase